jgi:hypothetical protein
VGSHFLKGKIMFTIEYVKDLKWCDAEHTVFECLVKYAEFNEEHPSAINSTDHYEHIQEIWAKANLGKYGVIAEYVPPNIVAPAEEQPNANGTQDL